MNHPFIYNFIIKNMFAFFNKETIKNKFFKWTMDLLTKKQEQGKLSCMDWKIVKESIMSRSSSHCLQKE